MQRFFEKRLEISEILRYFATETKNKHDMAQSFYYRVKVLLDYMENPWFKGEHAESAYFNRVYKLYLKVTNHYCYVPTEEDEKELADLESHKPADPCPYSRGYLYP